MKFIFIALLVHSSTCSFSQKTKHQKGEHISQDLIINKWIHSVINIEGQVSFQKQYSEILKIRDEGKINNESARKMIDSLVLFTPRFAGTAIFLKYNEKHYLVTAKHVLADTNYITGFLDKLILRENISTTLNQDENIKVDANRNVSIGGEAEITFLINLDKAIVSSSDIDDVAILNIESAWTGKDFFANSI